MKERLSRYSVLVVDSCVHERVSGEFIRLFCVFLFIMRYKQTHSVILFKKDGAEAKDADGIQIFPSRCDRSPDFSKESAFIRMDDLKDLMSGRQRFVYAYYVAPYEKPVLDSE